MMENKSDYRNIYKKIKKGYIMAFIILLVLFSARQLIIQYQLSQHPKMSQTINIAGRQRMLSQKISKDVLLLSQNPNTQLSTFYLTDLKTSLELFKASHNHLQNGNEIEGLTADNSMTLKNMFLDLETPFQNILQASNSIVDMLEQGQYTSASMLEQVQIVQNNEAPFLNQMDRIVTQYDLEDANELSIIEKTELILFIMILITMFLMLVFIFYPAEKMSRSAFADIYESNENILKLFKAIHGPLFLIHADTAEVMAMNTDAEYLVNLSTLHNRPINLENDIQWVSIDRTQLKEQLQQQERISATEIEIKDNKNNPLTVVLSSVKGQYKKKSVILVSLFDITLQKNAEEAMKNIAIKDKLTGLYNRYFLDSIINEEIDRSERYEIPLSLVILDIDRFKLINDRWGHPIGDTVLKHIADTLNAHIRTTDYFIRIGGEEFIILMPQTASEDAYIAAERLRKAIENSIHPVIGKYTASFGVAERKRGETYRNLYKRVDEALYQAKESGRNRVAKSDEQTDSYGPITLRWKSAWNCGENTIDEQHKELFRLANALINTSFSTDEMDKAVQQLNSLLNHISKHFEYEESVIYRLPYTDYAKHKNIHNNLLSKGIQLKEAYLKGEITSCSVFAFVLEEVIIGHLLKEDVMFFPYIKDTKDSNLFLKQ